MADDTDRGIRIGFRIEFWEHPNGSDLGKLAGDAYIEDAYLATVLPRVGELVASQIIVRYGSHGLIPPPWLPVPFIRVAQVEHYPMLPDVPGGTPHGGPGVQVVLRVKAPDGVVARDEAERLLSGLGWTVNWVPGL